MSKVLLIFFLFLFCSDVLSCPIGLSDSSPGISCSYIYGACGLTDQLLWVLPVTSSIPYQAWCASDGWALAMKIDGNSPLFGYNSGYWVNNSLYNSDPYLLSSVSQAKLQPFIDTPGDSIRLVMVTPNGNTGSPLLLSVSFSSLQALFSGGTVLTNAALSSWYNIIPGGAARQPNCNYQGINIATGRIHQSSTAYARLAIMFNNENECISIVSFLGIGLLDGLPSGSYNYNSPLTGKSIYAGSVYACCGECGVDYCSVATITYVYVRGPTPTPTVTATASVTSKPTASSSATGLPPISGRVVELSSTACSSLLSVQEIVIVTADTSAGYNSRNLARSAVMSASSFFTATPPSLANDGIVDQVSILMRLFSAPLLCSNGTKY